MRQVVTLLTLLSASLLLDSSVAFTAAPIQRSAAPCLTTTTTTTTTQLDAKKRRRRKTDDDSPASDEDDLPDFVIDNPEESPVERKKKADSSSSASKVMMTTPEGEEITAAMMGRAGAPTRSVRDLLTDRSLEQKLSFDVDNPSAAEEELPDLLQMGRGTSSSSSSNAATGDEGTGKKKAKQAARQAAAMARQQEQEEEITLNSLLKNVPFFLDEKGQVSGVKILEAGTWTGIALLVSWEFYINSPLFDRAAPLSPVVY